LRGKLVVALVIASALPLIFGVLVLHTVGFRYLLAERGRVHAAEARNFAGSLEQEVETEVASLLSWIAADDTLAKLAARETEKMEKRSPEARQAEIRAVSKVWEEGGDGAPQVRAVLENPGADSLRAFVKRHPQVAEVMATDAFGRVVATNLKTTDYDQSDEEWWAKAKELGVGGMWSDTLHLDQSSGVYSLDLVMPLREEGKFVGVIKMVVNASPLFEATAGKRKDAADRFEIALPDGRILARLGGGDYVPLSRKIDPDTMLCIMVGGNGWTVASGEDGERMIGFAGIRPSGRARKELPSGYVLISTDSDAVVAPLRRDLLWMAVAAAVAVGLCGWAGYKFVSRKILRPLKVLRRAARAVSETAKLRENGDADFENVPALRARAVRELKQIQAIRTGDEVEELADDLAVMTTRVLRYHQELETEVEAKTATIHEDLELAREFQNALMPGDYPEVPAKGADCPLRLDFAHFYQPAATVGGDFFDLVRLDDCRVVVMIADVMGHGTRSALVTAIVRALERNLSTSTADPGELLGELNRHLHEIISRSGQSLFVTAFLMVLDTRAATVQWAVAGHPAPLRIRRDERSVPQPLWTGSPRQPALGLMENAIYRTRQGDLVPGDVFLLYTDGAVEAEVPGGGEFGLSRLKDSFAAALDGPLRKVPEKIIEKLSTHVGTNHYDDDVCLVVVETCAGVEGK